MSQLLNFTHRLLATSTPAEVMIFKPEIEGRLESFLNDGTNFDCMGNIVSDLHIQPISRSEIYASISELFAQAGFDVDWPSDVSASRANKSSLSSNPDSLTDDFCRAPGGPSRLISEGLPKITHHYNPVGVANQFVPIDKGLLTPPATSAAFNGFYDPENNNNFKGMDECNIGLPQDVDDSGVVQYQVFPLRPQVKRQKMIYYCHFGEFGVTQGQFTEPSGVAVSAQGDIIVADTNNHRIQVFDNDGRFKFHFGECGKRDGQLLYPNRYVFFILNLNNVVIF